jgi:hypothetical protein
VPSRVRLPHRAKHPLKARLLLRLLKIRLPLKSKLHLSPVFRHLSKANRLVSKSPSKA